MKTRIATAFLAAPVLALFVSAPASASELKPSELPAEAKWVVHVDLKAASDTQLAEQVRQNRPQMVRFVRQWFQNRYGIDPREDLEAVTMYSDTYESHTGTLVLKANYDRQKVQQDLENKPGAQKESWEDLTLYTFTKDAWERAARQDRADRPRRGDQDGSRQARGDRDDNRQARGDDQGNRRDRARRDGDRPERDGDKTMTIVLVDDSTAVFASSVDRAKQAVQLVRGNGTSLSEDSPLVAGRPEGTMVYGAAIELSSIAQRDGVFPVLKQHEKIVWTLGEKDGKTFDKLTLTATSEEVAQQMKTALEGAIAFGKVWAADSQQLSELIAATEVTVDGKTVERNWQGDNEQVLAALGEIRDRVAQRLEAALR